MSFDITKLSKEEIEKKKQKYYMRNFITLCIEAFLFSGAQALFSPDSVLPVYVSKLSENPFSIALITIINYGLCYSVYIFACPIGVNTKSPKWTSILVCFLQRIGFMLILFSTYVAAKDTNMALVIFYISLAFYSLSGGLSNPLFQQMISVSIYKDVSKFYGTYSVFGALGGVLGTVLYNKFLTDFTFPVDYRYTFLVGLIIGVLASVCVAVGIKEITDDREVEHIKMKDVFAISKDILKNNESFRDFTILRVIMVAADFAVPYYIVSILANSSTPQGFEGTLALIFLISKMVASYFEGVIGDRYNPFATIICCTVCGFIASALAIVANSIEVNTIMYIFLAFAVSGSWIATSCASITFSKGKHVPIYSATISLLSAPLYIVITLGGATIASLLSYNAMFFMALIVYLICTILGYKYFKKYR